MRILILGGNGFLGWHLASAAVHAGHEVTTLSRGTSGTFPDGVTAAYLNRDTTALTKNALPGTWDAAIDVARQPGWVRGVVEHLGRRVRHYVFISSLSVYPHTDARNGLDETADLVPPLDSDRMESMEFYGPAKVRCEAYAARFPGAVSILRPGLIGGPGDVTGRSGYWPWRFAQPGPALVPADQGGPMQLVDARDLAAFAITIATGPAVGTVDVTGTDATTEELLHLAGSTTRSTVSADTDWLSAHGVSPWMGPRSMPLWLPSTEYWSMFAHTGARSRELGYSARPLADTLRDSAASFAAYVENAAGGSLPSGLSEREQQELLDAWHRESGSR